MKGDAILNAGFDEALLSVLDPVGQDERRGHVHHASAALHGLAKGAGRRPVSAEKALCAVLRFSLST